MSRTARADDPNSKGIGGEQATRDDGRLTQAQRRSLALLGLPTFGLALAATTVTTYLPVLLSELAGPTVIGALIGMEGLLAISLPILIGSWSDRVDTRLGRRMPFVLAATPIAVVALILMPVFGSLLAIGVLLLCFYIGYFSYYAPYRALYPDLVSDELRGRSQSFRRRGGRRASASRWWAVASCSVSGSRCPS